MGQNKNGMKIILKIIRFAYSLSFCLRYLPLQQAIKIPICINPQTKICRLKRCQIILPSPNRLYKYMIMIGYGGSLGLQEHQTRICMGNYAKLKFEGKAIISEGTVLRCDKNATIRIGANFYCNKNNYFRSSCEIMFGNDCLLGWNNTFNTTDGHSIGELGKPCSPLHSPIAIGNHVWITTHCNIHKGCSIPSDCVVAANSVVTKTFSHSNTLIGRIPAKEIKTGIFWKR